ncbi:unnamed protein product [Kuraishia capsulata CBS 1993]|uniref:Major facilitator superfamily (MFS) profile domain-containing protein n=1 Tax=Kuraishia capsulata CBS 1993 TaxID=1382522 RepID=W6MPU0_9ASCO|nr:uncharacterized protein KUCA_T00004723001 [Kuraishia capsulata CBS 1993]CDK28739.1 unnamed protein product [Kuraishia capsulata CBS 1993]
METINSREHAKSLSSGTESSLHENLRVCGLPGVQNERDSESQVGLERSDTNYSQYPDQALLDEIVLIHSTRTRSNTEKGITVDPNEVTIEDGDAEDMYSIPMVKKVVISFLMCMTALNVTMLSSCWSLVSEKIMSEFHVGHEVSTLGVSLFIWGMGVGPLFLSPISEYYGRKATYVGGLALTVCFEILTCFSRNLGGMLFGRFMSGFFGSAFLSVAGGTFSDIFVKEDIAVPVMLFSLCPFMGPSLGPLIAGFIADSNADYRWLFYSLTLWTGTLLISMLIFVPETYRPVLLARKAAKLRKETGNQDFFAPLEKVELTLFQSTILSAKRPLLLLVRDPMMLVLCVYTGLILAIVYLFFVSFPYTFRTVWGFGISAQGMSFLGLLTGMVVSSPFSLVFGKIYLHLTKKNNGIAKPEFRFPSVILGGLLSPIALFMMAWTSYANVHWIGLIVCSSLYGVGTSFLFSGVFTYTVDAYRLYAASAMAANSFTRSTMAGVFPLFGLQMYEKLGVHWATMLLGFISLAMSPFAFIFYKKGEYLRSRSPYGWSE